MSSQFDQKLVNTLLDLSGHLASSGTFITKMEGLCAQTRALMDSDRCSIFLKSGNACWGKFNAGNPTEIDRVFRKHRVPLTDPMVQEAFAFRKPVLVNNTTTDRRMHDQTAKTAGINAIVIAPLLENDEPIGFITAEYNQRRGTFTELDATLLNGVAKIAATMISIESKEAEKVSLDGKIRELQRYAPLGRLAGGLAHDFNNTLTIIMGYCELIQIGASDIELHNYIEAIKSATLKASNLSRQLLTFSKGGTVDQGPVDLNLVLSEVTPLMQTLLSDSIELKTKLIAKKAWVYGDRSEFDQLVMNLVLNARDAIAETGTITLTLAKEKNKVLLTVADTGTGIPPELLERIFDPFFSTKDSHGLGLGLANVKSIVDRSDGNIEVESLASGTSFRISFPEHEPGLAKLPDNDIASTKRSNPVTLLIVDDQVDLLEVQTQWLRHEGYNVISTPDPGVALQWLAELGDKIDILVTDMLMPQMSGKELIEQALALGLKNALVISGYQGSENLDLQRTDINLAFLQKPFRPSKLQAAIEQLLSDSNRIEKP